MKKDNFMNSEWKKCGELNDLLIGVSEFIIAILKHTISLNVAWTNHRQESN